MRIIRRRITRPVTEKIPVSKGKLMFSVLMAVLLCGVLIGSVVSGNMTVRGNSALSSVTDGYRAGITERTFGEVFLSSLTSSGVLVFICFFMGFCAVGQPVHVGILIFRGIGLGATIAHFYSTYGFSGFLDVVFLIVPGAVVSSLALILAAREGMRFSNILGGFLSGVEGERDCKALLRLYMLKFAVLSAIIVTSSLLDAVTAFVSSGF